MLLLVFGGGFDRIVTDLMPGVDFMKFVYPGMLAMTVLTSSAFSGESIVWDREFGFLKEILVTPLGRGGIVLGKVLGSAAIALLQSVIMLVVAPFIGVSLNPLMLLQLIPILVLISITLSGLFVLIASRMRSQQSFLLAVYFVSLPMMALSGTFLPVDNVSLWMMIISKINPMTYGVDACRQLMLSPEIAAARPFGGSSIGVTVFGHTMTTGQDVLVIAVIAAVFLSLAIYFFSKQE
jgi:ABC-2 type transport system permease protein